MNDEPRGGMRNVWLISIGFFFVFAGLSTAQQYLTVLFKAEGRENIALLSLLLLYGTFLISSIFVSKLIPALGGLKRSLLIGVCTYALFTVSIIINTPLLLSAAIIMGIGAALVWVSSAQLIADSSTLHTAGRNLSIQVVGQNAGSIAGLFAATYITAYASIPHFYMILTALTLFSLPFLVWIRPIQEELRPRVFKPLYMFDRRLILLFPLLSSMYFLAAQSFTAMNGVIIGAVGIGEIALIIGLFKFSNIIGSFSIGSFSDRFSKVWVLIGLIVITILGIGMFVTAVNTPLLIMGALLIGFAMAAVYPVVLAWLKERLPADEYLYALGVFHIYTNVGVVGAIVINFWLSPGASFIPAIMLLLIAIPCTALFNKMTKK